MQKSSLRQRFAALAALLVLIAADQLTKVWAVKAIAPAGRIVLLPKVLGLQYTENTGISFSLFQNSSAAMLVITIVAGLVMLGGLVVLLCGKLKGVYLVGAVMILAGGVGNLADRLMRGFVVDFIAFLFARFPVFNVADICITCGVAWVTFWVLREEIRSRKKQVAP